ncbi:Protein pelota, partial [Fragariocoptes setiger]
MKIVHRQIDKNGEGKVGLIPEEADDLWQIYNLIQPGDQIRAPTMRKVINESATSSTAQRVKVTLTLSAEKIDYDAEGNVVKVKGKNIEENKHVKVGQYHTLDLELNKRFFLTKPCWDSMALNQLYHACDPAQNSELAVVIMQEGLAFVCLITNTMTIQRAKIEVNIPRKRKNFCSQHDKGLEKFYDNIIQAIIKNINFAVVKCVIVASPGFVKDQFLEHMWREATKQDMKVLLDNRQKFMASHSSTGFKHSIREVLSDPVIQSKLEDTKAIDEVKIWNKFHDLLANEPNKAAYGLRDVEAANHYEAIETLMISDKLFRSTNVQLRKRYAHLIHSVKSSNGDVKIFSSMHPLGERTYYPRPAIDINSIYFHAYNYICPCMCVCPGQCMCEL